MRKKISEKIGKNMGKALVLCGIVSVLAACGVGTPAGTPGTSAQDLNIRIGAPQKDAKSDDKQEEQAAEAFHETLDAFQFTYEGVTLTPGGDFDASALGDPVELSTVPSCAFDGNDNVYNYGAFELTAHVEGDKERIYSIYFIDSNLSTPEGLSLGDTVDDMKSLYGEDCAVEETSYTYTRGDTSFVVIVQDGVVFSIEYRMGE